MSKATMSDIAEMLFGGHRLESQVSEAGREMTETYYGTAASDSSDGKVSVYIEDDLILPEDEDGNPIGSTAVELPTTDNVREGDQVRITANGGDNGKAMTVTGAYGGGDRLASEIADVGETADAAATAAAEAYAAAEAQEQIVWSDGNGVHVATDKEQTGGNVLVNALGVLLRLADKVLTAMTASGLAVYDGEGNDAENVVATFGENITLGKNSGKQLKLGTSGLRLGDSNNTEMEVGYTSNGKPYYFFGYLTSQVASLLGDFSVSGGHNSAARGTGGVALGESCLSVLNGAVALGQGAAAGGAGAVAAGNTARALADGATAFGTGTRAELQGQLAFGKYNVSDTNGDYALIYGNGTSDTDRSNGFGITPDGVVESGDGGRSYLAYELFSGSGTAYSTLTLSDDVSNYDHVVIDYYFPPRVGSDSTAYGSTTISAPNGKNIALSADTSWYSGSYYYTTTKRTSLTLSGTNGTLNSMPMETYVASTGTTSVYPLTLAQPVVTRIVGYK